MRSFTLLILATFILCSCAHNPTDSAYSAGQSTGVLEGTVEVYDSHLQRKSDASGVLVRFYNSDGVKFETTTRTDGFWELALPFGVYQLDTIQLQGGILLHPGNHHAFDGYKLPIDWLGKGRRSFLTQSQLCPESLEAITQLKSHTISIDTTLRPEYYDGGNFYPAEYRVTVRLSCVVETSLLGDNKISFSIRKSSGSILNSRYVQTNRQSTSQDVELSYEGPITDFIDLENAEIIVNIESHVWQQFWLTESSPAGGWALGYRNIPVPLTELVFPLQ